MNASQQTTLEQMLENLENAGESCGFMCMNNVVWIRGPGAPWTDTPTLYTQSDLDHAIASGKVRAQTMTGSATWTYYVLA